MNKSIFGKLLLSHIAVILVSMITLGILMAYLVYGYVEDSRRRGFLSRAAAAVTIIDPIIAEGELPDNKILNAVNRMSGCVVWLTDKDGSLIAGRLPRSLTDEEKDSITVFVAAGGTNTDSGGKELAELSLTLNNGERSAVVLAMPLPSSAASEFLVLYNPFGAADRRPAAPLHMLLLYSLLAGVITAFIAGFFISRGFTKTIASISRAASDFAKGNYQSRIIITTQDEIGQLGRTFNTMAEELSQIEQNRRDFLSNVSHELKTPIASIQVLVEAILDDVLKDPAQRERYLRNILAETKRISRLINDLLELSQLESGQLSIVPSRIELADALGAMAAQMEPFLDQKGLSLDLDLPPADVCVLADPVRLNQVLTNLFTNAIRHAPADSAVAVKVAAAEGSVAVSIVNSGPGILPEELPRIWERFYRTEKSRAREGGGTGLGLAITKKLVEAMRGGVSAQSIPDVETIFTFTLPRG